jgi:hypothetical protein
MPAALLHIDLVVPLPPEGLGIADLHLLGNSDQSASAGTDCGTMSLSGIPRAGDAIVGN